MALLADINTNRILADCIKRNNRYNIIKSQSTGLSDTNLNVEFNENQMFEKMENSLLKLTSDILIPYKNEISVTKNEKTRKKLVVNKMENSQLELRPDVSIPFKHGTAETEKKLASNRMKDILLKLTSDTFIPYKHKISKTKKEETKQKLQLLVNNKMRNILKDTEKEKHNLPNVENVARSTDWPSNRFFKTNTNNTANTTTKELSTRYVKVYTESLRPTLKYTYVKSKKEYKDANYKKKMVDLEQSKFGHQTDKPTSGTMTREQIEKIFKESTKEQIMKTINEIYVGVVSSVKEVMQIFDKSLQEKLLNYVIKILRVFIANLYHIVNKYIENVPINGKVQQKTEARKIYHWLAERIMTVESPFEYKNPKKSNTISLKGIFLNEEPINYMQRKSRGATGNQLVWSNLAEDSWYNRLLSRIPGSELLQKLFTDPGALIMDFLRQNFKPLFDLYDNIMAAWKRIRGAYDTVRNYIRESRQWLRNLISTTLEWTESYCRFISSHFPVVRIAKKRFFSTRLGQWILRNILNLEPESRPTIRGPGPFKKETIIKSIRMVCDPTYKETVPRHPFHPTMGKTVGSFIYDLFSKDSVFIEIPTTKPPIPPIPPIETKPDKTTKEEKPPAAGSSGFILG